MYGLWPAILRLNARGILFLYFRITFLVVYSGNLEKYNWNALSSKGDHSERLVVVVFFSQYVRQYQCVLLNICSINVELAIRHTITIQTHSGHWFVWINDCFHSVVTHVAATCF